MSRNIARVLSESPVTRPLISLRGIGVEWTVRLHCSWWRSRIAQARRATVLRMTGMPSAVSSARAWAWRAGRRPSVSASRASRAARSRASSRASSASSTDVGADRRGREGVGGGGLSVRISGLGRTSAATGSGHLGGGRRCAATPFTVTAGGVDTRGIGWKRTAHCQTAYGSEGWGFESLRARSVETDDPGP